MYYLCYFLILCSCLKSILANNCQGCVPLDSFSFHKVISKFHVSIVKFDSAYPYGPKHEEFSKLAESAHKLPNVLIAEVGIKEYGNLENMDLAKTFNVNIEKLPTVKLFRNDSIGDWRDPANHETYSDPEFTVGHLKMWIRAKTDIILPLPGCLVDFDRLATKFSKIPASDMVLRSEILKEGEVLLKSISDPTEQLAAESYVKTMKKILDKGDSFIDMELQRVESMKRQKISESKLKQMDHRINILQSFQLKDEL